MLIAGGEGGWCVKNLSRAVPSWWGCRGTHGVAGILLWGWTGLGGEGGSLWGRAGEDESWGGWRVASGLGL